MTKKSVRTAWASWCLVLALFSCDSQSDSPEPSPSGGVLGAAGNSSRAGGGNAGGNAGQVARGGASGATNNGGASGATNNGGTGTSVEGGSSGSSAGASEIPVEGGSAGAAGSSVQSGGAPAQAGSTGFDAGAPGAAGAGGNFAGPLPICPSPALGGGRGECDSDTEAALATVRLELVGIENASTGEPIRPGDDATLSIQVSTLSDSAPADRVGLLVRDHDALVTIEDGPCYMVSDFGIVAEMPQLATFNVRFSPQLEPGTRVHFVSWASPYHSGCASQLLEFDVSLQ